MTVPDAAPAAEGLPLVLVLVGTDHHAFDRLVGWVDEWAGENLSRARVLVQRGTSREPSTAESVQYLEHARLQELMEQAAVVVCHGGPTTIAESRRLGTLPIVVPRDPAFSEHVDAHQMRFTRRLAADGLLLHAVDRQALVRALDGALDDAATVRVVQTGVDELARSSARFGEAVAALFPSR